MRAISESFFAASPVIALPIVGLLIFVSLFVAVVVVALRTRSPQLERAASLPFENDEPTPGRLAAREPGRRTPNARAREDES